MIALNVSVNKDMETRSELFQVSTWVLFCI